LQLKNYDIEMPSIARSAAYTRVPNMAEIFD